MNKLKVGDVVRDEAFNLYEIMGSFSDYSVDIRGSTTGQIYYNFPISKLELLSVKKEEEYQGPSIHIEENDDTFALEEVVKDKMLGLGVVEGVEGKVYSVRLDCNPEKLSYISVHNLEPYFESQKCNCDIVSLLKQGSSCGGA